MKRLCLDTSAYIRFRANHSEAVRLITHARWVAVSTVVLGELFGGFLGGSRTDENRALLEQFMAMPLVETVDVTVEVAQIYAGLVAELRRTGKPIPQNDVWIAATTIHSGALLLTFDRHFDGVPGLHQRILTP